MVLLPLSASSYISDTRATDRSCHDNTGLNRYRRISSIEARVKRQTGYCVLVRDDRHASELVVWP